MDFCRACVHEHVNLLTLQGLHAARHLYEKAGFRLVKQRPISQWGAEVNEQQFEWQSDRA